MKTPKEKRDVYWTPFMETLSMERLRELRVKKFEKIVSPG